MAKMPMTLRDVAELVGGRVEGDASREVRAIAPLEEASETDLTFADGEKHVARLPRSKAAAAIVGPEGPDAETAGMAMVRVPHVQAAMAALLGALAPPEEVPPPGVHASAVVADDAEIAPDAAVGPAAVVGPGARIGARSVLCAGAFVGREATIGEDSLLAEGAVVKARCVIGNRVRIGPNSVVGGDGFGYYFVEGEHRKVPHAGNVVIDDDVEIGACSCVDRAKFGSTHIGAGTKIDNLVQVAHSVRIGRGCLLAAEAGVAGSARLGNYVVMGGNSGIRDNITVGDGVQCAAFAAVAASVPAGQAVVGVPAGERREQFRIMKACAKVPDLLKRVRELEARLESRGTSTDD
jgi:UDP-3-O-[3-hydroxymyristoyl] glucosamine N-acyltransferase